MALAYALEIIKMTILSIYYQEVGVTVECKW